jgi:hypothetical protein
MRLDFSSFGAASGTLYILLPREGERVPAEGGCDGVLPIQARMYLDITRVKIEGGIASASLSPFTRAFLTLWLGMAVLMLPTGSSCPFLWSWSMAVGSAVSSSRAGLLAMKAAFLGNFCESHWKRQNCLASHSSRSGGTTPVVIGLW